MRLLLDTEIFIWSIKEPELIPTRLLAAMANKENDLILSIASVWEMQIKIQLGKLTFQLPLAELIATQQTTNEFQLLPVELHHVLALGTLPHHHKDPFDRLIIAQAIAEDLTLISVDTKFPRYPVKLLRQ